MSELKTFDFLVHENNEDIFERRYEKLLEACYVHNLDCQLEDKGYITKTFEVKKHDIVIRTFDVNFRSYKLYYSEPPEGRYAVVGVLSRVGNSTILEVDKQFKATYLDDEKYDIGIPDEVYSLDLECEHCNSGRNCKKTFLVFDFEEDMFFQVAQGCLTGYIYFSVKFSVEDEFKYLEDEKERTTKDSHSSRDTLEFNLESLVKHTFSYFLKQDELKFISRYASTDKIKPSVTMVLRHILGKEDILESVTDEQVRELIDSLEPTNGLDPVMLETFKRENKITEYKAGYVIYQVFRTLAGPVTPKKDSKKEPVVESNYIGEEGEKIQVDVVYEREVSFETDFGWVSMYFFKTDNGDVLVWRTAKNIDIDEGDRVTLKGKVKTHNEYNGVKQTFVSYVKLIESED